MSGVRHICARVTALVVVLALFWPMATAVAAAASAPARPACCMRMSQACHSQQPSGDKFEAVCRTCGWCHALPNAPANHVSTTVTIAISTSRAALHAQSESRTSPAPSRLHASRAPPLSTTTLA